MLPESPPISPQHSEHRTHEKALNAASSKLLERRLQLKRATERLHVETLELRQTLSSIESVSPPDQGNQIQNEPLAALRPREIEVLRLIAQGNSTKQIAAKLRISFKTAVCYRTRLLEKLDIHETASLVRLAIRTGLIVP